MLSSELIDKAELFSYRRADYIDLKVGSIILRPGSLVNLTLICYFFVAFSITKYYKHHRSLVFHEIDKNIGT